MSKSAIAKKRLPTFVAGAVAAAVIPIPIADSVAISAVQLAMLYMFIHEIYKRDIGVSTLKGLVAAVITSNVGIWLGSFTKAIPIIGTVFGILLQMTIAGTLTAALGLAIIEILEKEQDFSIKNVMDLMKKKKGEAKNFAEKQVKNYKSNIKDIKIIQFKCETPEVQDTLVLTFNAHRHTNTRIDIINSKGNVLHTHDVDGENQRIDMPFNEYEKGSYSAVFKADGVQDITLFFVKL